MFQKLELTRMAQAMASHAGARLGVIAQNIANADTQGYKVQDLPDFAETYRAAGGDGMRATRPGHFDGTAQASEPRARIVTGPGAPNGNTVSLEREMVKAVETRQQHEMALAISSNTSAILRASLGRGR